MRGPVRVGVDEVSKTTHSSFDVGECPFEGGVGTRRDRVGNRPVDVGDVARLEFFVR